ncbi:MAG: hypothetical protein KKD99_01840 [Proteobacteria bacterium]|nr:hypothetical protein [Pseudomonadota bacterium]
MTDKAAERTEILRRLDILAEFQAIGLRVATNAQPNDNGWLKCHSLYRTDNNPSAGINVGDGFQRGIYVDFGENGWGGKLWLTKGIFNVLAEIGSTYVTGRDAYYILGKKVGVIQPIDKRVPKPSPTLDEVKRFQKNLTPEIRQFLQDKRGLSEASLAKFEIGWDPKRERNAFPVYVPAPVGKTLVNIRFHNSKKTPKTLSWSGFGEARLWGLDRLAAAPQGSTVGLQEGELDAALFEQETGFIGVSSTNGVKAFKPEWTNHFHGHHVVVMYDCDQAGREGVQHLILPAFKEAVTAGRVLTLKVIWLYDTQDKEHKDLTDWIVKDGGSGEALKKLIAETPPYTYPTATSLLPDPIDLDSLILIDKDHCDQRVSVSLQIFGENTVAYHAPTKIKVTYCLALKDGKCSGCKGQDGRCLDDIYVPMGDRVMLAGVRAPEGQLLNHVRTFVCDRDKRPALKIEARTTVREAYAHQIFEPMKLDQQNQIDKQIYLLGGDLVSIGKYRATGFVRTSWKDQQPVLIVDNLVPQEEDFQSFDLDTALPHLEKLKAMDVDDIIRDLSYHVTRIYERHDQHLGVLLTLCSPLWINFPGDGRIRGWLTAVMVGDTGTGKTFVSQGLFEFAKVGDRVSGLTASRTGIVYGLDHDPRSGWRVKAGALLKMNRQALIVDEAQDLPDHELKPMAEGLDTGMVKIDRIQQRTFESATRTIFCCNPKDPKNPSNQRKMADFRHGCLCLENLFTNMMLRRIDFVLFSASGDIKDKSKIFNPPEDIGDPQVSSDDLRALIFWAWNLKEDQIIITPEMAKEIRKDSLKLSQVFGCDSPPIVYPEDFRKTMARLSVAYAVLDLSTNEDFTQVIVRPGHVHCAADFIEFIYQAENCRLHKHAQDYRETYGLEDFDDLKKRIDKKMERTCGIGVHFLKIMSQLYQAHKGLKKADLADEYDVDKKTIQREMSWFVKNRLVLSNIQNGYLPGPRLFNLVSRLEKIDREKYDFGKRFSSDDDNED